MIAAGEKVNIAPDIYREAALEEARSRLRAAMLPPAAVKSEPHVYEERSPHSFFHDLGRAALPGIRDERAEARLERYALERSVDGFEQRTNMTSNVTGIGNELTVPLWLVNKFTTQARAGRVLSDLVTQMHLPRGVSSVHVPKETTGTDAPIQPGQNQAVQEVDIATADSGAATNIVTLAGESDASLQVFEQAPAPGFDAITYLDLSRAYNANLEQQCLAGTGSSGQLTGVTNVASRNTDVSGAGATTVATFWPLLGQLGAAIGNNRKQPMEFYLMAPRRWSWLASSVDSSNRPIASPGQPAHMSDYPAPKGVTAAAAALGAGGPVWGPGFPVYLDGAITAGASTDYAVAVRASDMLLFESDPKFTINMNPLSGTLQVRLQLHRYAAFINTKPSSISVLTALPAPANF